MNIITLTAATLGVNTYQERVPYSPGYGFCFRGNGSRGTEDTTTSSCVGCGWYYFWDYGFGFSYGSMR